jgi:hypothetical protein
LALVMAAARAAARTSGLAVRLAMMVARSAPWIPRCMLVGSRLEGGYGSGVGIMTC